MPKNTKFLQDFLDFFFRGNFFEHFVLYLPHKQNEYGFKGKKRRANGEEQRYIKRTSPKINYFIEENGKIYFFPAKLHLTKLLQIHLSSIPPV